MANRGDLQKRPCSVASRSADNAWSSTQYWLRMLPRGPEMRPYESPVAEKARLAASKAVRTNLVQLFMQVYPSIVRYGVGISLACGRGGIKGVRLLALFEVPPIQAAQERDETLLFTEG